VNRVVPHLPESLGRRIQPSRFPWRPAEIAVVAPPQAPVRLLVGPVNSAGQGYAWARAAERGLAGVGAVDLMMTTEGSERYGYPRDQSVPRAAYLTSKLWQRRQRAALVKRYTHVLAESGLGPFGQQPDVTVADALRRLQADGPQVALLFHGSDIRIPSEHARLDPASPFIGSRYPGTDALEENALRNRALIAETGLPVFVSTPDLLHFAPAATWLPVVVDVEKWSAAGSAAPLERARPVVVHAPSNAGLKGSELISATMTRLHDEGVVEYREVHGVPSAEMPRIYGEADVVLDQFSLGIYGVATVEALAAGRLVLSHVGEATRRHVAAATGVELPVVETSAAELEARLREIAAEPERYRAIAALGPGFAREVHDGWRSAAALAGFLGAAPRTRPADATGALR
jgi:hypothetical protein